MSIIHFVQATTRLLSTEEQFLAHEAVSWALRTNIGSLLANNLYGGGTVVAMEAGLSIHSNL